MAEKRQIPAPTLGRICTYIRVLERSTGSSISSAAIADAAGVNAAQVRKDLSYLGEFGQPGVGYGVGELREGLKHLMGLDRHRHVVIVGAGALGSALITYPGFEARGFRVAAVFDNNPAKIGHRLRGHLILPADELPERIAELGAEIGVIAVPRATAQAVADTLVQAGIKAIVNFAPVLLRVPETVAVRNVDLTQQLECLAYYLED
jgi:redox-sensing transcriptional repressor